MEEVQHIFKANKIDISNLGSGIYLLKIAQDNKHITRKIIIE